MTSVVNVDDARTLDRPVLFVALHGWVDAGTSGRGALAYLEEVLTDPVTIGHVDLAELVDLQQTRPQVRLADGALRTIEWPRIDFVAGRLGTRDVILCRGPEPGLRWQAFCDDVAEYLLGLGVRMAVMMAGMPVVVSHRRPLRVLGTATVRSLAQEIGPLRPDFEGPTGLQTALQFNLGRAGIPSVGLWAQVPHYLAGYPCPAGSRAIVRKALELANASIDLAPLDQRVHDYEQRVEAAVRERDDLRNLVEKLDANTDDLPSGDEIASEIERFLREDGRD